MLEPRVRFLINTPQVLIQNGGCFPTPRLEKLVLGAPERCGLLGDTPWLTMPLGVPPVTSAVVYVGVAVGCHPSEVGPALTAWSLEQGLVCCSLSCLPMCQKQSRKGHGGVGDAASVQRSAEGGDVSGWLQQSQELRPGS